MKGWCLAGLASAELSLGDTTAATRHARALLKLPDFKGRHAEARAVIKAAACLGPAPAARAVPAGSGASSFRLACADAEFRFVTGKLLEDNGVSPDVVLPASEDALGRALADMQTRLRRGPGARAKKKK